MTLLNDTRASLPSVVEPTPPSPKNLGGRPKGVPNRPKWLLDEIKARPKLPRGRPKGSKGKPKTLEGFFTAALTVQYEPPPPPKPKRIYVRKLHKAKYRAIKRRVAIQQSKDGKTMPRTGTPDGWNKKAMERIRDQSRQEANRIFKIMQKEGLVPEDEMAQAALKKAFAMMHENNSTRDKLACARTVLEFTKTKPATKTDVTIKTAEDFLDELANFADDNDDPKR